MLDFIEIDYFDDFSYHFTFNFMDETMELNLGVETSRVI